MESEIWSTDEAGRRYLELPETVTALVTHEGRLLATLADGRTVDVTDWFADSAPFLN